MSVALCDFSSTPTRKALSSRVFSILTSDFKRVRPKPYHNFRRERFENGGFRPQIVRLLPLPIDLG
jgi:hypothetical protein